MDVDQSFLAHLKSGVRGTVFLHKELVAPRLHGHLKLFQHSYGFFPSRSGQKRSQVGRVHVSDDICCTQGYQYQHKSHFVTVCRINTTWTISIRKDWGILNTCLVMGLQTLSEESRSTEPNTIPKKPPSCLSAAFRFHPNMRKFNNEEKYRTVKGECGNDWWPYLRSRPKCGSGSFMWSRCSNYRTFTHLPLKRSN